MLILVTPCRMIRTLFSLPTNQVVMWWQWWWWRW